SRPIPGGTVREDGTARCPVRGERTRGRRAGCEPGVGRGASRAGSITPGRSSAEGEESGGMANRLGPKWLNQVQSLAVPTHAGRLGRFAVLADKVNALEPVLEAESDEQLKARSHLLKLKARQGDSLSGMLIEAFALVREAAKRTIQQRHY